MTQEPVDFSQLLGNGAKRNPLIELSKKLIGRSDFTMAAIYNLIDELLPKENADKMKELTRQCDEELTVIGQRNGKNQRKLVVTKIFSVLDDFG